MDYFNDFSDITADEFNIEINFLTFFIKNILWVFIGIALIGDSNENPQYMFGDYY